LLVKMNFSAQAETPSASLTPPKVLSPDLTGLKSPGTAELCNQPMYWQIVLTDGTVDIINRHSLADRFFGTEKPKEKSALFADDTEEPLPPETEIRSFEDFFGVIKEKEPPKKQRRRRGRRGGRRNRKVSKTASASRAPKKRKPEGSGGGW